MNVLQADIDALESERGDLKDKVKTLSKRTVFEGLAKLASPQQIREGSPSSYTMSTASASLSMSEAGYVQQISTLRKVLSDAKQEAYELKMQTAAKDLQLLPPVKTPRFKPMWLLRAQGTLLFQYNNNWI